MFATALIVTVLTASSVDTTYAFVGVSVIPMDRERVLENQTVVVQGGQVVALGPASSIQVPRGAVAIDGRGRYLMPGLAEMHAHIPSPPQATMAFAEEVLFLYAAGGVTTIRGMLGNPVHLDLRQRVASGEVLGPQIWTSSPSINGNSVRTPAQADSAVRGSKAAGYDFLKIHPGVSREAFDRLDATADEVGIPFSGHVPAAVGIFRALEARYASIDHLDGYIEGLVTDDPAGANLNSGWFGANIADQVDVSRIPDIARRTREAGVWNVPTQTLAESYATAETAEAMARRPEIKYIPPQMRSQWITWKNNADAAGPDRATRERYLEVRRRLIKALHDAGAGLLLGSDAPQVWNVPGFSVWRELETIVAAGLTPFQALQTGTVHVARFFGVERAGTVAVGMRADLILLDRNPLAQVGGSPPVGVMLNGRWLPQETIRGRLEAIAAQYAN